MQFVPIHYRIPYAVIAAALLLGACAHTENAVEPPFQYEMIRIEGGSYLMGDIFERDNEDALPIRRVEVGTFRLSKYETTYEQYDEFARATGRPLPHDEGFGRERRAVARVSWSDARAFCRHYGFRLPTEEEWEYAARSGGRSQLYAGTNRVDSLRAYAWLMENTSGFSMPVGLKRANALGLYDMTGNVAEWIGPFYEQYPEEGAEPAFKNLSKPGMRLLRGGDIFTPVDAGMLRTYWRTVTLDDTKAAFAGFRCAD